MVVNVYVVIDQCQINTINMIPINVILAVKDHRRKH